MDFESILKIAPSVVALVAVIVGPIISLRVAKRQTEAALSVADLNARSTVLSKNRQEWINTLRNELSLYISKVNMVLPKFFGNRESPEFSALLSDIALHQFKIKLLINPNEDDHKLLVEKVSEIAQYVFSSQGMPTELNDELVSLSQKILKREWERVKTIS